MDCSKIGTLLLALRKEHGLTQRQLADQIHVSDKTVSKWERGLGCPDVSLLPELSEALGVNMETILLGDLDPNHADGGNMKRIKFYVCPTCGNILTATGTAELVCCGRKLTALVPKPSDEHHHLTVEAVEDDLYLTFSHEMRKEHYLNFVACVNWDRVLLVRLYPEQSGEVRIPRIPRGKLYFGCNQHGLWVHTPSSSEQP